MTRELAEAPVDAIVDALDEMNDKDFTRFLGEVLGPDQPGQLWEALLGPDLLDRTGVALASLRTSLDKQAAQRRIDIDTIRLASLTFGEQGARDYRAEKLEYDRWRRRSAGYRRLVDARQRQWRAADREDRQQAHEADRDRERNAAREVACRLALGVDRHRQAMFAAGMAPDDHDVALWRLLDDLSLEFGGNDISLAEAIEQRFWYAREGE